MADQTGLGLRQQVKQKTTEQWTYHAVTKNSCTYNSKE